MLDILLKIHFILILNRSRGKHGSLQSRKQDTISTTETIVPAPEETDTENSLPNQTAETIIPNNPVVNPCPFTSVISEDHKRKLALKEFDEKVRKSSPSVDKALITRSGYHQSLLRVSWNLIESEILHSPGKKTFDIFQMIYQNEPKCISIYSKLYYILNREKLQYRCVYLVKSTSINKVIRTQSLVNRIMQHLLFSTYQLFQISIKERREIKSFFHEMR